MMKKLLCLILLAVLLCSAGIAESPSYDIVYSANNPIPDIADRVRPAVVQVVSCCETWDAATRIASTEDVSSGSGCYFRAAEGNEGGYILTNYHIVEDGEVYRIEWLNGEAMDVELVGYDDGTDIAILKFNQSVPEGVEVIPMGDSDKLRIGELAICIGNPGNSNKTLLGTVTAGIVSGLEREGINAENFSRNISVIQIDAAINSGNSGGAMLNAKGELVGIPTLKMMFAGDYSVFEGLGFCVPINTVSALIDQIITTGGVIRPRLGITVADIDGPDEPMKKYQPIGVQVYTVEEKGSAYDAGLQVGDVITEIDGVRIEHYTELLSEIDKHKAGDVVELKVYRYYDAEGNLTSGYEEYLFKAKLEMLD